MPYRRHPFSDVRALILREARRYPDASRIFLADGDVMRRPFEELRDILHLLNASFPRLARVSLYANGASVAAKTDDQLRALRALKLHTLYLGLESGDEEVLRRCRKGQTASQMVQAGGLAQAAGLRLSVMVLLGLGGDDRSREHIAATADALNRMQPRLLSALRVIPIPGTALHDEARSGRFRQVTEWAAVQELRDLIDGLAMTSTVFRANHSSNVVPLEGRLPRDTERLLAALDALLASDALDRYTPGPMPLSL